MSRLLRLARIRIVSNTAHVALIVITKISTMRHLPRLLWARCHCVKLNVASCVYEIAYEHGTRDGPTRSYSGARDRASLDSPCCDAYFCTGACVYLTLTLLGGSPLPRNHHAAHFTALFCPSGGASPSRPRHTPPFRACPAHARTCARVCAPTLPVRRPLERPTLPARRSTRRSRGRHGAQQVVPVGPGG